MISSGRPPSADLDWMSEVADIVSSSRGLPTMCQRLVHGQALPDTVRGFHLCGLSSTAQVTAIAGYGLRTEWLGRTHSVWDESPHSTAIRENVIVHEQHGDTHSLAFPILMSGTPSGAGVLVSTSTLRSGVSDQVLQVLSRLLAVPLRAHRPEASAPPASVATGAGTLSARQLDILDAIAKGHTNGRIAADLHVSESTVRHETMRIYRAFGVHTREAAAAAGLSSGLIADTQSTPPAN